MFDFQTLIEGICKTCKNVLEIKDNLDEIKDIVVDLFDM